MTLRGALLAGMLCIAGCDRAASAAGRSAVLPPAVPDTVVRTVPRFTRLPSAIQRVTPALRSRSALEPLDSTLIVRVLDARGRELAGVAVRWRAPAVPGAAITVLSATTDSRGLSRAAFTPGTTADTQTVTAEVPGVGTIPFSVVVPVAALRFAPDHLTLWSGDSATVAAALRDSAGNALAGGSIDWGTADTSVARPRRTDAQHAVVAARLAGATRISAWVDAGKKLASFPIRVVPVIHGRVVDLDGRPVDADVELRAGAARDSFATSGGTFTRRLAFDAEDEVDIVAVPRAAGFHVARVRVGRPRDLQHVTIALVPTAYTIDAGTYSGRTVAIDAAQAMQPVRRTAPFWRLVPLSGRGPRTFPGWRSADLPLRIAFDRSRSAIGEADSVAFWNIARQLERDLGMRVFTPAGAADTTTTSVVRVEIRTQSTEGHTFVSWAESGDANEGTVLLHSAATLRDAHVVTHELVHLLGFGHAAGRPTVAQLANGPYARLTPEDVGYMQLAIRLRRLHESTGVLPGLPQPR